MEVRPLPCQLEGKHMAFQELNQDKYGEYYVSGGYTGLLATCNVKILAEIEIGSYQGQLHALVEGEDGRWGYYTTGYGSCSGCDALCDLKWDNKEAVEAFRQGEFDGITWFSDSEEAYRIIETAVVNDETWYYKDQAAEVQAFLGKCNSFLDAA